MLLGKVGGFYLTFSTETNPYIGYIYTLTALNADKKVYQANDKAHQLLVMSYADLAYGFIYNARTKNLKDRDAFLAKMNLIDR